MNNESYYGITGRNEKLLSVIRLVEIVAPTDTLVLILGESGTGKERIAECIHELSSMGTGAFVKVNCAALPTDLIESILFGYEKGAFTGAAEKRIGKFELANNGTIFLDEIGTLPLDAQAKLLRVLQEHEIERIGGHSTIKVNVRVIAATNSELEAEVAKGNFRMDLYYRLKVFPLLLPPLRDRKDDIPLLVQHFIHAYSNMMRRPTIKVTQQTMSELLNYNWPGNIRELKHLIEKAVVLGEQPSIADNQKQNDAAKKNNKLFKTIHEVERDHILMVLSYCNGKIKGEGGASDALQIAPATLRSKIKRLGIQKIKPADAGLALN